MKKTLLIGNGVNRINSSHSWEALLDELVSFIDKKGAFSTKGKPFPYLYEEILLRAIRYRNKSEDDLRMYVCKIIGELESNNLHKELLSLDIENIITTNYDYNFERANNITSEIEYGTTPGHIRERLYRLYTYNKADNKKIWHIHGEANYQETLVLGHEKYSRTLQNIINYAGDSILLKTQLISWIDLFLSTDIDIIGLSLDYTEIDLWWLLNYRAREMFKNKSIKNRITYYIPSFDSNSEDFRMKKEMLFAHDVIVSIIQADDYSEFYYKLVNDLKGSMNEREISA